MLEPILEALSRVFGGDTPNHPLSLGQIAARCVVIYLGGVILVRLGKNRLLSNATPLDVILAFLLGSLLSRGITGSTSLSGTLLASATLVGMHWVMTRLAWRWHTLGNLIKGRAQRIVRDGVPDEDSMRRSHISEHDLMEHLRLQANIDDLSLVKSAYEERNGDISIVKAQRLPRIIELPIEDGVKRIQIELTA